MQGNECLLLLCHVKFWYWKRIEYDYEKKHSDAEFLWIFLSTK